MPTKKTAWPLIAAALFLLQPADALASPPPGKNAGTSVNPIPIRVGETYEGVMPSGPSLRSGQPADVRSLPYPIAGSLLFEVTAEEAGPLTIEARSLDFDTGLRIWRTGSEEPPSLEVVANHGGIGANARAVLDAKMDERLLIELFTWHSAELWGETTPGGEFELSVELNGPPLLEWPDTEVPSRPYFEEAAARARENGNHRWEALAIYRLALTYTTMHHTDWDRNIPLFREALGLAEAHFGPVHAFTGGILRILSINLRWTGDYAGAREAAERALAIAESLGIGVGEAHRTVGDLLLILGFLGEARDHILTAIDLRRDEGKVPSLGALNNLGGIQKILGQFEEAEKTLHESLRISEARIPQEPKAYGVWAMYAHLYLVDLLLETGDWDAALDHSDRAFELYRQHAEGVGPQSEWYLGFLLATRGKLLRRMGSCQEAREVFEQALPIYEKERGPDHPWTADILEDSAWCLEEVGAARDGIPLAERALSIHRADLGPDDHRTGRAAGLLARLNAAAGDRNAAFDQALSAQRIGREHLRLTSRWLNERHALLYAARRTTDLDLAFSLLLDKTFARPERIRSAWDQGLRSRAVILDEISSRHRAAGASAEPEVQALLEDLRSASTRLANLQVRGPGEKKEDVAAFRGFVTEARQKMEEAQDALAARSVEFRRRRDERAVGLDDVARALPTRSALVAYWRFEEHEGDRPLYAAFALKAGGKQPAFVPLGSAEKIDRLVENWKTSIGTGEGSTGSVAGAGSVKAGEDQDRSGSAARAYRKAGAELRRRVWDPVAAAIGEVERVFIVPDGALNLVAFAALPRAEGGYLVEAGPILHHLSAERDLVRPGETQQRGRALLAMGGADFDSRDMFAAARRTGGQSNARPDSPATAPGEAVADLAPPTPGGGGPSPAATTADPLNVTPRIPVVSAFRGSRSGCGAFHREEFDALPASEEEVAAVTSLWSSAPGAGEEAAARALTGASASETAFKADAPGKRVVHLATHGFFLGGECPSALERPHERERGFGAVAAAGIAAPGQAATGREAPDERAEIAKAAGATTRPEGENPLLLSGLAFAGANNREHAGPDEDDGILTAQEIAAMDLSSVEWAVLSACDTGVGEIRAGEGVFGLRRAFQVAGADTLIMSLWSVEDEATRQWMTALYEGRLTRGLDTAESVRRASLTVLRDRRDRGLSDHPFYWGAFVAAGDWR